MSHKPSVRTARDVRAEAASKPEKYADLPESALHTLAPGARGRLHPEAIARFNKGKREHLRYALGNTGVVKGQAKALRTQAVALGAGARGPLSKAVQESLSQKG